MQLIATARFQAAANQPVATKPYNEKLAELVADLRARPPPGRGQSIRCSRKTTRTRLALVAITSTRAPRGGYNSNVLRVAIEHLRPREGGPRGGCHMAGKKGISYFRLLTARDGRADHHVGDVPRSTRWSRSPTP
jgi:F0F1-type ATP synthase gamma subunit